MAPTIQPECIFGCQARGSVEKVTPPPQWYCQCCGKSWPVEPESDQRAGQGYWDGREFHVGDVADY